MSDLLFPYYEGELLFIREMAKEFAVRYPAAAGRLVLEGGRITQTGAHRELIHAPGRYAALFRAHNMLEAA